MVLTLENCTALNSISNKERTTFCYILIAQVFIRVVVRAVGGHHILEVVCGEPGSVWVSTVILEGAVGSQIIEIWDCHWPQNPVPICHSTEMDFSGDQPSFASDRDATPPTNCCFSSDATISLVFSVSILCILCNQQVLSVLAGSN